MNLSADGKLRLAARLAFVVGVGAMTQDAFAQEVAQAGPAPAGTEVAQAAPADEAAPGAKQLGGVQVTGSRIRSPTLTSNSPVTVVGAAELKFQGTTRVEDLINNLPQAFADQGGNISNGSSGTATVNLRNLGASRTLVLVDGKRLSPGNPGDAAADLNFVPAQLVDKIEVLTGGASAVYGTDAVAGVVNFILKKDFEGVRIDYQRSGYLHDNNNPVGAVTLRAPGVNPPGKTTWDGAGNELSLVFGINSGDGKGNATVYASYLHLDPITQERRDFSACTLAQSGSSRFACSGSSTGAPGRFIGDDGASYTIDPATGNTFRPYVGSRDSFNFGPYNYFQRTDERYSFGAFAHYEFNSHADAYANIGLSDDRTNAVIAPSGAFFGNTYNLPCDSPLLSADQRSRLCASTAPTGVTQVLIGRRNVEGGGRDADFRHTQYRLVFGLKGDIVDDFTYDASVQYGTTILNQVYRNDFSNVRLNRAFDVTTDANGAPVCRSVLDGSDPNCVPYNVFTIGGVTPEALTYLQTPGFLDGRTAQQVATGSISGTLGRYGLKSPFADDGVGVAVGGEYRRETSILETDTAFSTGDLAGQGGATIGSSGAYTVKELFAEISLPLVQHQPFFESLSVDAGYRRSNYTSTASTDTYKIGGEWAPTKDVRFRGGFNRAVRAPAIGELVNPINVVLDGSTDPCSGAIGANGVVSGGATRAQCANDPLIAANPGLYGSILENPAAQYNGQVGTSPGLQSERSNTYTAGIVFTPTFVKNFSLTVDYFDIKVNGIIAAIGADNILSNCYTAGQLCNLINRNPNVGNSFGSLWLGQDGFVIDFLTNTGFLNVRGIDVNANYRFKLSEVGLGSRSGSVSVDFVGTRNLKQIVSPITGDDSANYSCQGRYGLQCGTPVPLWRHKLRTTYTVPTPLFDSVSSFSAAWRYTSHVTADQLSSPNNLDRRLPGEHYIDLTASISFKSSYTFRIGVNNVLDNDPPVIGSGALPGVFGNGNTFPQVYDALGRYLFAGVTLDF